ncbi:hypothetical protein CEXT_698771 [Caerostris extrusa]|uniref:Uncharacterized protein n=1 Tax=Caerostris extrusa TaxID=172846 RepID=A0AAV4PU70_CAEEX|nr:hypothetical protein CEXT_698771 [Caerostris extrusa]
MYAPMGYPPFCKLSSRPLDILLWLLTTRGLPLSTLTTHLCDGYNCVERIKVKGGGGNQAEEKWESDGCESPTFPKGDGVHEHLNGRIHPYQKSLGLREVQPISLV